MRPWAWRYWTPSSMKAESDSDISYPRGRGIRDGNDRNSQRHKHRHHNKNYRQRHRFPYKLHLQSAFSAGHFIPRLSRQRSQRSAAAVKRERAAEGSPSASRRVRSRGNSGDNQMQVGALLSVAIEGVHRGKVTARFGQVCGDQRAVADDCRLEHNQEHGEQPSPASNIWRAATKTSTASNPEGTIR